MRRSTAFLLGSVIVAALCLFPSRSATGQTVITNIGMGGEALTVNPRTNRIYVSNSGGGSVRRVDGYSHAVVDQVMPGGTFPQGVVVNPVTNRVYVQSGGGTVQVLDGDTHAIVNTVAGFGAIAFNLATARVYVLTGTSLRVLNASDESQIAELAGVPGRGIAVDPLANQIFVANADGHELRVIDGVTHAVQTISNVFDPVVVAVNPQTRRIYVAEFASSNIAEFDAVTLARTNIAVPERPSAIVVDSVSNKIYIGHSPAAAVPAAVTVIDGATRATTPIAAGIQPAALAFDPGTRRVFAVNQISGTTTVINADTQSVITTLSTCPGSQATHITLNPVTHRAYVQCLHTGTMAVIDGAALDVVTHAAGLNGSAMAYDSVQGRLVVGTFTDTLRLVDPASGADTPFAPVPGNAVYQIAFDPGGNHIVAVHADGRVSLIDGDDLGVRTSAVVSVGIAAIGIDSARGRIFCVDSGADTVRVLDTTTLAVTPIAVGDQPQFITVDEATGNAYVSNWGTSNSVTRIDGGALTTLTVAPTARPAASVYDAANNRLFVILQNTARVAVMNGTTLAHSDVNLVSSGQSIALNPRRGLVVIGHAGSETRISLLNAATLAAPTTVNGSGGTNRILVDAVRDRIYAFTMDSMAVFRVSILRGPTNTVLSRVLTTGAQAPVLDLASGRVFFHVGSDLQRINADPLPANTLSTTIANVGGHRTDVANASVSFTTASSASPTPSPAVALFHRTDYAPFAAATPGAPGTFSASVPLTLGSHYLQAFALDAFGATTQATVGSPSAPINRVHAGDAGRLAGFSLARVVPTSIATTTTIGTITPGSTVVGEGYSVPVTVSGSSTPTGTVDVDDGAGSTCQISLVAGSGNCLLVSDEVGAHTVTANYTGQGLFQPSSDNEPHSVGQAATTTTIESDAPDPSVSNQQVTVQVTVAPVAPGAGTPSGQVDVAVAPGGSSCNGPLSAGSMSCALAIAANGNYTITASYGGDASFAASVSNGDSHLVEDGADLFVAISDGQAEMVAGASAQYAIAIGNNGPSQVFNARVRTPFPAALAAGAWTCTASGGASCIATQPGGTPASGNGALDQYVDVPVGGTLNFSLAATLASSHSGSVVATATVGSGVADANPANNSASDSNASRRVANLSITKSNGCFYVPAGGYAVYTITVNNSGPSDAPGTRVQDTVGGVLTADSWICGGSIGSSCTSSNGTGNIDQLVYVPAQGYSAFLFVVAVANGPPNQATNIATLTAALDVEDSTPGNNSASDTDLVAMYANGFEFDCQEL
jgi:YVTN family beta-propeller protein